MYGAKKSVYGPHGLHGETALDSPAGTLVCPGQIKTGHQNRSIHVFEQCRLSMDLHS